MSDEHFSPKRRFDAVICDVDGCLAPERASDAIDIGALARVAEYNRLAYEVGDRPIVTLCTGRPQPFAEAVSRLIGNKTLPAISEMGVWLWWPTDNAYVRDPAITASNMHAVHAASEWIETEFGSTGVVQQPGKTCSISLYHADTEQLMEIRPRLEAHFREHAWPFRVTASWLWINLELEHVSKATGIDRLTNATGIPTQRLMGIGDTMGDLAIRERVEWFACPANAQDALKQHADYVSEAHEAHGVLDILDRAVGV